MKTLPELKEGSSEFLNSLKSLNKFGKLLLSGKVNQATELWLESEGEFVTFPEGAFSEYEEYHRRNPNRFEVRYDSNLNRKWHKEG